MFRSSSPLIFPVFQLPCVNSNYRLKLNTFERRATSFFCTSEAEVYNYIPGALPPHLRRIVYGQIPL